MSDKPTGSTYFVLEAATLRAEIERLRAESNISDGLLADAKAEVEQLRAALQEMTSHNDVACAIGRRALEPKP